MGMAQGHRMFAALWDRASRHEGPEQRAVRARIAGGVRGRTLELGVGVGSNWPFLPGDVDYTGIEPDRYMLDRARRHAAEQGRHVELHEAAAEQLPFPDAAFDTVLVTLTLCTVDDVPRALAEARRVLKPDGELRFWEHVRPRGRVRGRLFDIVMPAWRTMGGGCRLNRNTLAALTGAGFEISELREDRLGGIPFIDGVAVPAGHRGQPSEPALKRAN